MNDHWTIERIPLSPRQRAVKYILVAALAIFLIVPWVMGAWWLCFGWSKHIELEVALERENYAHRSCVTELSAIHMVNRMKEEAISPSSSEMWRYQGKSGKKGMIYSADSINRWKDEKK